MRVIERMPQIEGRSKIQWQTYAVDTVLGLIGALLVTGIIYVFHLYPTIPDISIIYLLLILPLATRRSLYAAILAAVVASLSFDFFLVPPLYTLTIYRPEEWFALLIFLIVALFASQLADTTRQSVQLARRREREARILYELLNVANSQEQLADILEVIALAMVRVFMRWGVRESAIVLPDQQGNLKMLADAPLRIESFTLSPEEWEVTTQVLKQGKMLDRPDTTSITPETVTTPFLRLIPLKVGGQALGVLCLRITDPVPWFATARRIEEEQQRPNSPIHFFWTFVEQATSVIERARLRARIELGNN